MKFQKFLSIFVLLFLVGQSHSYQFFTSNEKLKELIETSFKVTRRVEKFLDKEEKYDEVKPWVEINFMWFWEEIKDIIQVKFLNNNTLKKSMIKEWKTLSNAALDNATKFVANPFNCFFLIKQLTLDLDKAVNIIQNDRIKSGTILIFVFFFIFKILLIFNLNFFYITVIII